MKSFIQYLSERNSSSEYKFFRLVSGNLENFSSVMDSLKHILTTSSIYYEDIDGGIKIKLKKYTDVESIVDLLMDFINSYEDKDDSDLKNVSSFIDKIQNYTEDEDDDGDSDEDE